MEFQRFSGGPSFNRGPKGPLFHISSPSFVIQQLNWPHKYSCGGPGDSNDEKSIRLTHDARFLVVIGLLIRQNNGRRGGVVASSGEAVAA